MTATLSKALASQGGAVLGTPDVVAHVIDTARSFIFDTALAPASVAAALEVLRILETEPEHAERVRQIALQIHETAVAADWRSPRPDAAVISLLIGDPSAAVAEQQRWVRRGLAPGVFRPPSVPDGRSRLRLTAHAGMTAEELGRVAEVLAEGGSV